MNPKLSPILADAFVSAPLNDRVENGHLILDINAVSSTLKEDENGIGLEKSEGSKPEESTDSSIVTTLLPLPFHGSISLVSLSGDCDRNMTGLSDLSPIHATGTLLTQLVKVPRKMPIGSSSSKCINGRQNLDPPPESIASNRPHIRLNDHNSLMELSNKNNAQQISLTHSGCNTSPTLSTIDIQSRSATDTEVSSNRSSRSNSRKRTGQVDYLETSKRSRVIGAGDSLTMMKTSDGIYCEVAIDNNCDQPDQPIHCTDIDVKSNGDNQSTNLPYLTSGSSNCKIDLTDDS